LTATLADDAVAATRAAYEQLVHPDFETIADPRYQMLLGEPGAGAAGSQSVYHGLDGFIAAFREWLSAWDSWVVTPSEFIDLGENRVLVLTEIAGRSERHGAELTIEGGNVVTLRDGKLARLELFFQRLDALEAAGLQG
jgi:ketosteroid isomerase-like protein